MRKMGRAIVIGISLALVMPVVATSWKTYRSLEGWSIKYPSNFKVEYIIGPTIFSGSVKGEDCTVDVMPMYTDNFYATIMALDGAMEYNGYTLIREAYVTIEGSGYPASIRSYVNFHENRHQDWYVVEGEKGIYTIMLMYSADASRDAERAISDIFVYMVNSFRG